MMDTFESPPEHNKVYWCDAMTLLRAMPSNSVDCCVTSPPYFGLRDYGVQGQIGLEPTPQAYVQTLVTLFRELRRVLKDSGTFWLNLGDSYNGSGKGPGDNERLQTTNAGSIIDRRTDIEGLAPKQLMLIPHRVAIALQDDGWIVRQDNVWHKPNPMPESVTDRTTRAHEYVFQLAKSGKYWYDAGAVQEPAVNSWFIDQSRRKQRVSATGGAISGGTGEIVSEGNTRNKRSVWTIPPAQFKEAHFATFPLELPEICIKAGCPPGGLVLDPFMGSGTTALVARSLGRNFIGSELNAEYIEIAEKRLAVPYTPDMFIMQELKDYQS